jgi:tRNA(Ile2) C34 agmatinyltransferase TiaS
MAYCPEDGAQMECTNDGVSFADYHCPKCGTDWQYDAEQGCYRVIQPDVQLPERICQDGSIAI